MTSMEPETQFHLSDSVLARIVQIIQEGILLGIDVTDLMRQIRLRKSALDPSSLVLDPAYVELVKNMHNKLESFATEAQAEAGQNVEIKV